MVEFHRFFTREERRFAVLIKPRFFVPRTPIATYSFFATNSLFFSGLYLVLLTASALISGAEVAFFSLTPSVLELKQKGKNKAT